MSTLTVSRGFIYAQRRSECRRVDTHACPARVSALNDAVSECRHTQTHADTRRHKECRCTRSSEAEAVSDAATADTRRHSGFHAA